MVMFKKEFMVSPSHFRPIRWFFCADSWMWNILDTIVVVVPGHGEVHHKLVG